MSCTSPFTVPRTMRPRPPDSHALHVRLEVGDGGLHRLGRAEHERQLHLARAEQLADGAHPGQQHVVHDVEGGVACVERLVELGLEAVAVAVHDALLEAPLDGPAGAVLGRGCGAALSPSNASMSAESGS